MQQGLRHRSSDDSAIESSLVSELCSGTASLAYAKSQRWKKEESQLLKGEGDQT